MTTPGMLNGISNWIATCFLVSKTAQIAHPHTHILCGSGAQIAPPQLLHEGAIDRLAIVGLVTSHFMRRSHPNAVFTTTPSGHSIVSSPVVI